MASPTRTRLIAMALGHAAIIAGVVFLTIWRAHRMSTGLLVGGIAALACGIGLVALTVRHSSKTSTG